jgi:hypothetical protein
VVAPALGGPLDIVADGETGFLVPPHTSGALVDAVARLAGDPALRLRMGRAARARMLGRSWAALGDELIGHYSAALGGARLAAALDSVPEPVEPIPHGVPAPVDPMRTAPAAPTGSVVTLHGPAVPPLENAA